MTVFLYFSSIFLSEMAEICMFWQNNVLRIKIAQVCKVRISWEGHKIWKNLPLKWHYSCTWKIFSNFVAFSEYPNFSYKPVTCLKSPKFDQFKKKDFLNPSPRLSKEMAEMAYFVLQNRGNEKCHLCRSNMFSQLEIH